MALFLLKAAIHNGYSIPQWIFGMDNLVCNHERLSCMKTTSKKMRNKLVTLELKGYRAAFKCIHVHVHICTTYDFQ